MSAIYELLADYNRLRNGEAECNSEYRNRLAVLARAEHEQLVAALQDCVDQPGSLAARAVLAKHVTPA